MLFSIDSYAFPSIKQDKYLSIFMEGRGINSRQDHNHYQSKGLNTLIKVDGKLYMVSLDEYDNIVIDLINDTKKEEFLNTRIKADLYNGKYRGTGTVCTDGSEHLYITYCYHDGSVKTAKISLKTKTVLWTSTYSPLDLNYFPLDAAYNEGNLYMLICEDQKSFHIAKMDCESGDVKRIAEINNNYKLNALSVCDGKICVYGSESFLFGGMQMYKARYDFEGNRIDVKSYKDEEWRGSITRAFVEGNEEYVLYKQNRKLHNKKNKIISFSAYKVLKHTNIFYDTNSIYAEGGSEYIGYGSENDCGYQIYNSECKKQQSRFIKMPVKVSQNNAVYCDGEKVYILSSLENGDAVLSFIPYKQKFYVYTNEKEENFKDSVVYPRISLTENGLFTYKIKYVNYLNEAPPLLPKLRIYKNGAETGGSPFAMQEEDISDKNYTDGKIYKHDISLSFAEGEEYSYKIECSYDGEGFESEIYPYPIYGSKPRILSFDGEHILPKSRYDTTKLEAKMKFMEPNGYEIDRNYPVISIYTYENAPVITNVHMQYKEESGGLKIYACSLGRYNGGKYRYKIEARNEMGTPADAAEGEFEIIDSGHAGVKPEKIFNVPNPFSPHGKPTKIIFECDKDETVKIKIYTFHGDLVYEDAYHAREGTNEYEYKGRDGNGRALYNGAYMCQLEKPDGKRLRCKLLVVK